MATEAMKLEVEQETCCVCGGGGELLTPEEHDAGTMPMQVPLRAMLLHLNSSKVVPEGRLCGGCIRRAMDSYEFSTALTNRGTPPLSEKIRALRKRLHELTQKIDVFIVVGGAGPDGSYSEEDIIMVERDTLAAATAADNDELERERNARGDHVYQCSVCPSSFPKPTDFRAHLATHPTDALHSCWTCGSQFATRIALKTHLGSSCGAGAAVGGADGSLHCPACGASAADRAALGAHCAASHGRDAVPPLVCPACFRTCDTPELLSAHLLRHRQARHYVCGYDSCILRFVTRSNLMAHIRKCHTGVSPPRAPSPAAPAPAPAPAPATTCDTCGRTFGSAAAMKRHARVHHRAAAAPAPRPPSPAPHPPAPAQDENVDPMETDGDLEGEGEVEYLEVEELEDVVYQQEDIDQEY